MSWGNERQMAKKEAYEGGGDDYDYNNEDALFNYAKTIEVEKKEDVKNEEKPQQSQQKPEQTEEKFEKKEGQREKREKKRRKKLAGEAEDEEKKEKSDVPDNSVSYKEYKEKMKSKEETKHEEKKGGQRSLIPQVDLKVKEKNTEEDEISIASNKPGDKKQPVKAKEKKVDRMEEDLNKIVGQKNLEKVDDRDYQQKKYDNKQQGKYAKKENQGQGFSFSKDAFPELK